MPLEIMSGVIKKLLEENSVDVFDFEFATEQEAQNTSSAFLELANNQLDVIWRKLYALCRTHIGNTLSDNNEEIVHGKKAIEVIVQLAKLTLAEKPQYTSQELLNTITFLSDWLPDLPNDMANMKNDICQLCEQWLSMDKDGKELMASHTVLYILQRALQPNSQKSNLQRIWNIHASIHLSIKGETESSILVFNMMKKCFSSKLFLTNKQGKRILSFFLTLDAVRMEEFHTVVKNFLMSCSLTEAEIYGSIYLSAWCNSNGDLKKNFEEVCLQDLVFLAVHLPPTECKLFSSIRKVLRAFKDKKLEQAISSLILRIYDPIIWRSLKVANSLVRKNASILLFDMFPVEEPNSTLEEAELIMDTQCRAMKVLLDDPDHSVRAIAVYGICSALESHWEVFPSEQISQVLQLMCNDLIVDASSAEVRAAVLKGLRVLLGNHLSYPALKTLLPKMYMSFHEVSGKVRLEFCNLLLKIKTVPVIEYWKVVPMDHLLARLAEDEFKIGEKIVDLICNSFFSASCSDNERVYRSCELINMNRRASQEFFHHLARTYDIKLLTSYPLELAQLLYKNCQKESEKKGNANNCEDDDDSDDSHDESTQNKENIDSSSVSSDSEVEKENYFLSDQNIVCGLLDSVCILWWGLQTTRSEELRSSQLKNITESFRKVAPLLFQQFKKCVSVQQTLIYLCSCVKAPITNLRSKSLSMLKAFPDAAPSEQYLNILGSICYQNELGDLLDLILSWLSFALNDATMEKEKSKRKKKTVTIVDPNVPKPLLAIHFLQDLLLLRDSKRALLDNHRPSLQDVLKLLPFLEEKIYDHCNPTDSSSMTVKYNCSSIFLVDVFSTFCQLILLLHVEERGCKGERTDCIDFMSDILFWLERKMLPLWFEISCTSSEEISAEFSQKREIPRRVFEIFINAASSMYLISVTNDSFTGILENFLCSLLQSGIQDVDISLVCKLVNNVVDYAMAAKASVDGAETPQVDKFISNTVSKLLQTVSKNIQVNPEKGQRDVALLKPEMTNILITMLKWLDVKDLLLHDVIATLMAAGVADLTKYIERYHTFEACDDISDLPPVPSTVLAIFASRVNLLRIFLEELQECLLSGVIKEMCGCLAVVHIVRTLLFDEQFSKDTKDFCKVKAGLQKLFANLKECNSNEDSLSDSDSWNKYAEMVTTTLGEISDKLM